MGECQNEKCKNQEEITALKIDIAVAKSNIQEVKSDIKETKIAVEKGNEKVTTLIYWLMGGMVSLLIVFIGYTLKG